jgi:hypothetical protein
MQDGAMNGSTLTIGLVGALALAGLARRGSRNAPERWYHLTDRAAFALDPRYAPEDNALAIEDRSGRPGIYIAPANKVEAWVNGHGYWRPFVVEIEVDPSVLSDPGVHGRWGGERFIPAASFGKLRVARVIPLDAFAREQYGDYGWIEDTLGTTFDTHAPISSGHGSRLRGYRYEGPDVRAMSPQQIQDHKRRLRAFLKTRNG